MDKPQNALMAILEYDNTNVDESIKALRSYGLLDLYERMPSLFEGLMREIGQYVGSLPIDPFLQASPGGSKKPALNILLRIHMTHSAYQQFTHASIHLLRGHLSEVYGHMRRAIEAAGIAYLSKSEPDLGEVYLSGDRKKLKSRTSTGKILPEENPLTKDLHHMIDVASGQTHNNFGSFVARMHHATSTDKEGSRYFFTTTLLFHEVNPQDPRYFLGVALWILRTAERVTRLLASSFDLPDSIWHRRLDRFQADLDLRCCKLYPVVHLPSQPPVE